MNSLIIKNLQKEYPNGVRALEDITIQVGNGLFGLLGPNGAGKSTLLRTIVGLQNADHGEIWFNEVNVLQDPMFLKKQLGFLPQDFGVYPKITAYDLLNHLAILKGVSEKTERKNQILALLEKVNLSSQQHKEVHTFSGGMKQRFGVAQALLGNPNIIIVDEPTAGLDPEERNRFNGLLSEIGNDRIVILSTHLVEDVLHLCSQMAIINSGKVLLQGNPNDFITQLQGKIWRKPIQKQQLEEFKTKYKVIASYYLSGNLFIQVYSNEYLPDFELVNSKLEDVYFNTLNQIEI
ncbi:ABC transporter ATP-binding protein [Flavobacterium sp. CYK-4]|uniref:ABC transporter ATP-binding protein n=1 Tax=Flavobacterium lotistagni TaxID=2709660 RepID=UPI00140A496F|nr:ABC transporter ATP-binding protein [Flavobacterium lotistagni]NHM07604.1 ABC transporter ATP-binding protein [Flavobacterium lotistagni]